MFFQNEIETMKRSELEALQAAQTQPEDAAAADESGEELKAQA